MDTTPFPEVGKTLQVIGKFLAWVGADLERGAYAGKVPAPDALFTADSGSLGCVVRLCKILSGLLIEINSHT